MRQDLLHCVVVAAHANAARDGHPVELPKHPAFRSVHALRFLASDEEVAWAEFAGRGRSHRLLVAPERTAVLADDEAWVHEPGPILRLAEHGLAPPPATPVADATRSLRLTAERVLAAASGDAVWTADLRRALVILDSAGTGEEVSDVAWPHVLLPDSAPLPARRLAAAAASCWIFGGDLASDLAARDAPGDEGTLHLHAAVDEALIAAVAAGA